MTTATASVNLFLSNPKYKAKLNAIVDGTHAWLIDPNKEARLQQLGRRADRSTLSQYSLFDKFTPVQLTDDFRMIEYLLKRNMSIGSVTATGGEVPATRIGQIVKLEGGLIKLSLSHVFDEETKIRVYELSRTPNVPQAFVEMLYGSVNDLQPKIMKLANVLMAQVLYQGRINFTDPRTNVSINLQYDIHPELFPAPLTGNALWTNYATANGIQNLIDHSNAFYELNGYYPECIKMSNKLLTHLLRQQSTSDWAINAGLLSATPRAGVPSAISKAVLDKLVEQTYNLPPIEVWDAQYELEIAPGETQRVRYFPDHTYVFLNQGVGRRLFAPTLESTENGRSPKAGIFVKTEENLKLSPPLDRAFAVARTLPFVPDTRKLAAAKVA